MSPEKLRRIRFLLSTFGDYHRLGDAFYHGKFVKFDNVWSWPKPVQNPDGYKIDHPDSNENGHYADTGV